MGLDPGNHRGSGKSEKGGTLGSVERWGYTFLLEQCSVSEHIINSEITKTNSQFDSAILYSSGASEAEDV